MSGPFNAKAYWEERLGDHYDLQGVGDISLPVTYNAYLYKVRALAFRQALKAIPRDTGTRRVLDVGSGTGFYVDLWRGLADTRVTGSDITDVAVANLSARFTGSKFIAFDLGKTLPEALVGHDFDVVSACDVLFHIVDDAAYGKAFDNFASLVRPGGHLIFSDNLMGEKTINAEHQVSRRERYVFDLLDVHGFVVRKVVPMFVFMNVPVRSHNRLLHFVSRNIFRLARQGDFIARAAGAAIYPFEAAAILMLRRGPSTEIFVCERVT